MNPVSRILDRFSGLKLFGGMGKIHLPQREISASKALGANDLPSAWNTSNSYWNPNLETGTDKQGQYWDLHEALRDSQSAACFDLRCQIAASLPYELIAQEGTTPEDMALTKAVLEDFDFPGLLAQMTGSTFYGLYAGELFWRRDDPAYPGKMVPWDVLGLDLQYVWFNQDRQVLINGRTPEVGKLILHTTGSHFRNPYGLGRGRTVPQWVRVKKAISFYTFRDYGSYSHDKAHFTYPAGSDGNEIAEFEATVQKAINSPAFMTRSGFEVKQVRLENQFEVGVKLLDACDGQIAKAILGNTLTTGEGRHGTQALGWVHESMTDKHTWADGLRNQTTLNKTLIAWITQVNNPGGRPPKISFDATVKPDDLKKIQALLGVASFQDKMGRPIEISATWMRETFNIPEPDGNAPDDAMHLPLPAPAPAVPPKAPEVAPIKVPVPTRLAAGKTQGERRSEEIMDRWAAQWRERVAGPHRQILGALGDGDE
jgi:hypothetical protein